MMVPTRDMSGGGDEYLIPPKYTAPSGAFLRVSTRLPNHRLENGQVLGRPVHGDEARQFHSRLVIILRSRQRRQSRAFPRSVIHPDASTTRENRIQIPAPVRLRLGARLDVRVQRTQPVPCAVRGPIFVHAHDRRPIFRGLTARRLQSRLPVRLLRRVRRAHNDGVVPGRPIHLTDGFAHRAVIRVVRARHIAVARVSISRARLLVAFAHAAV
mmetsp:Transcript_7710/g.30920  ORF Transcript_7710/g.30920 Transcript_7710/m.30920 type:complete len:213 (+) Transcript_7710:1134-1772(+)